MLQINNLCCVIENKSILKNISFSAAPGEFIGIIGANGAGKSSLFKCLCGINNYTGAITFNNQPLKNAHDTAKTISYMEQDTTCDFPFLTREIVMMGRYPQLGRWRNESAADRQLVQQLLAECDAAGLADRNFQQLSGGERQRALFARALAQQTPVMLLDEPASALDIACKEKLFAMMKKQAADGKTVIATLHDIKDAARHCARLLVLKQGQLIADGAPEKIMTTQLIQTAYGLRTVVYYNEVSQEIDYYINTSDMEDSWI